MKLIKLIPFIVAIVIINSCGRNQSTSTDKKNRLSGDIKVDGSSTVYPITEAVAEEFRVDNPEVKIVIGISGTGGNGECRWSAECEF